MIRRIEQKKAKIKEYRVYEYTQRSQGRRHWISWVVVFNSKSLIECCKFATKNFRKMNDLRTARARVDGNIDWIAEYSK